MRPLVGRQLRNRAFRLSPVDIAELEQACQVVTSPRRRCTLSGTTLAERKMGQCGVTDQAMTLPPFTSNTAPVMNDAASEARNWIMAASSIGSP